MSQPRILGKWENTSVSIYTFFSDFLIAAICICITVVSMTWVTECKPTRSTKPPGQRFDSAMLVLSSLKDDLIKEAKKMVSYYSTC